MSTPAKVFQLIFVAVGLLFIGLGLLGIVSSGDQQKSNAQWTCEADSDSPTTSKCRSDGSANTDLEAALGYVLVGIGLEAAAAALAAGSRPLARPAVPAAAMAYPAMQPGRSAPMGPMATGQAQPGPMPTGPTSGPPTGPGYPASPPRAPWSS
ncbi:hypothetical protein [Rugosimonospora africana]|uniref:Uncharacterized protein n=1 Tax=Rugosimonospora africana TaxID=556532 RepID=A0A8J3QNT9_9ACTN|nr:hypothetical protein [Rugosimonospora africana]GIH12803.1 hypothetical protein Raf01_09750 [Rugosimonospora africana]